MRVGFFTDTYFPQISGVATSIHTLKEEFEQAGHEVLIFTTSDPNADPAEKNIIRLGSIPFISFKERRIVVSGMLDAYDKAKHYDLDIIHTHTEFGVGWLGKFIGRQLEIPVVHTYHTMYEDYLHYIAHGKLIRPFHVRQASRAFCRNLSGLVCPSQRVVNTLKAYEVPTPMAVIPTGVNLANFSIPEAGSYDLNLREKFGFAKDDLVLLSLSRISFEKNIQGIIAGMPAVVAQYPQVKLLIVGGGPYLESLEKLVAELALEEVVVFAGAVDNQEVGYYYREADYFVSASTSESQGLTYIEALASGTQLVVKGNDYLAQLLDDSSLGLTFETDEEFAATLIRFIEMNVMTKPEVLNNKLYEISSVSFADHVSKFYQEAQTYYDVFIKEGKAQQSSLSLRLFKRR